MLELIDEREVLEKNFRVYGSAEEPLFLAKDAAEWIGYDISSVSKMLRVVDEDEKVKNTVPTLGGPQESWFLTEDGLYEVLMQSRKPIAKTFKKKVKEILKIIRQNGYYETPGYKLMLSMQGDIKLIQSTIEHQQKLLIDSGILRTCVNPRYTFERLMVRYKIATGDDSHRGIHEAIGDYFGLIVPYSSELNVTLRDYLIETVGIEEIQEFIVGIESGTIAKSVRGHYVNLNGYGSNNVEWPKVLQEFGDSCAYCGRTDVSLIPEHIIPQYYLAQSHPEAVDLIGNIVCSCGTCNKSKGKLDVDEWFAEQPFYKSWRLRKVHTHQAKYRMEES